MQSLIILGVASSVYSNTEVPYFWYGTLISSTNGVLETNEGSNRPYTNSAISLSLGYDNSKYFTGNIGFGYRYYKIQDIIANYEFTPIEANISLYNKNLIENSIISLNLNSDIYNSLKSTTLLKSQNGYFINDDYRAKTTTSLNYKYLNIYNQFNLISNFGVITFIKTEDFKNTLFIELGFENKINTILDFGLSIKNEDINKLREVNAINNNYNTNILSYLSIDNSPNLNIKIGADIRVDGSENLSFNNNLYHDNYNSKLKLYISLKGNIIYNNPKKELSIINKTDEVTDNNLVSNNIKLPKTEEIVIVKEINIDTIVSNSYLDFSDTDLDGIIDSLDSCITLKEDYDSYKDDDGCPDNDNDSDGIWDIYDVCPNVAGNSNYFGCPNNTHKSSGIIKTVKFKTGKYILKYKNYPNLNSIANIIKSNNKVVIITGYTDSYGSYSQNISISLKRANAVKEYIISKGIKNEQVLVEGRGANNPIYDNRTPRGRSLNRRIEYRIIN